MRKLIFLIALLLFAGGVNASPIADNGGGGDQWTVTRTGADIKIRCSGCGRIVMLDRESFLRRRKPALRRALGAR